MRTIPETANRGDWPRLVAQAVRSADGRLTALETATDWSALQDFADDVAAAAGGVEVGELYHASGAVRVRLT